MRGARVLIAAPLVLATAATGASPLPATAVQPIPAGYDLFETDPETTIANVQLPAGFFGPNSDPFNDDVMFTGEPIDSFMGHDVGDASTVVQRPEEAVPEPVDTVPIEIVALSLISMEPITVTYDGGQNPEDWDVGVGLSSSGRSQGQVTITRTGPDGGTFDAQLQVVPLFTFTRLTDGSLRTLDGAELPAGGFMLRSTAVPWRAGCILPALAVPGLNDGFCPSFTPDGRLQQTTFTAAFVRHGVFPAQPRSEHFKCYTLQRARFRSRSVTLSDQFGERTANVTGRKELCNPAQKNEEPYLNTPAHLVCYATAGRDPNELVALRNQFGSQRLQVREARRLCVPSQKHRGTRGGFPRIAVPIDHYQCYRVEALTPLRRLGPLGTVELRDQFGREEVAVGDPVQLCAPVQKNDEEIQHPVPHLVCYKVAGRRREILVEVRNQFERQELTARQPALLCVPSSKLLL